MAVLIRIILASILLSILLFTLYLKNGRFTLAKRITIGILILLLIGTVAFYEISYAKRSGQNREILDAFNQNKTLICEGHEVTSADFTFVGGTKVFMRKDIAQGVIPIEDCEVR
ncbi:MAG: hypothetical protein LBF71_04565 [Campylobacteraceae bacterium]|jgi:uncharacterized SAM-binding protein YcdF (DUF218 family)|nr:hypothetical protein [Campylobacteraceae bacterium]